MSNMTNLYCFCIITIESLKLGIPELFTNILINYAHRFCWLNAYFVARCLSYMSCDILWFCYELTYLLTYSLVPRCIAILSLQASADNGSCSHCGFGQGRLMSTSCNEPITKVMTWVRWFIAAGTHQTALVLAMTSFVDIRCSAVAGLTIEGRGLGCV